LVLFWYWIDSFSEYTKQSNFPATKN
jgi:hypothetical protein